MRIITRKTLARRHLRNFIYLGENHDFCGQLEQEADSGRLFIEEELFEERRFIQEGSIVEIPYLDREKESVHSRKYRVA